MKRAVVLGLLTISALFGADEKIRIGIRMQTPPGMPPALVKAVIRETERVWKFPALRLHWHQPGRKCTAPDNRLLMVYLVGACTLIRPEEFAGDKALGYTHVSDDRVLPFIDVHCDTVASVVAHKRHGPSFLRLDDYARALALVLTHEMVHALTGMRGHDTAGVMQPRLSPADLVEGDIGLTESVIEELEEALGVQLSETRH